MKILSNSLKLSVSQERLHLTGLTSPAVSTDSAALQCHNLRAGSTGGVEPLHQAMQLGMMRGRPVGFDRRGGKTIVLSQLDNGTLLLEGEILSDGSYKPHQTELARLQMKVAQTEACGPLLALRMEDGSLIFLSRGELPEEGYHLLGELPEVPEVTARAVDPLYTAQADVEAYDWKRTLDDLRTGIPSDIAAETGARVLKAYHACLEQLHTLGLWHQPVMVRFGYRLTDGRMLPLSAPQPVGLDRGFSCAPAVDLPLVSAYDADGKQIGYKGSGAGTLTLSGYRIALSGTTVPAAWQGVISGIEMYVSTEPECTDYSRTPAVTARMYTGSGYRLHVAPAQKSEELIVQQYADTQWLHYGAVSDTADGNSYRHLRDSVSSVQNSVYGLQGVKAGYILCHDEIMHLADIRRMMPEPLPGGFRADPGGNATVEVLSGGEVTACARFNIPAAQLQVEADGTMRVYAPLVLWHLVVEAVYFRLSVLNSGTVYESVAVAAQPAGGGDGMSLLRISSRGITLRAGDRPGLPATMRRERRYSSMVMTMQRGNCLVTASCTERTGGEIMALAAQCIGGGAYTRQYIYLFTRTGIIALTHNYSGEHSNCRSISPETVLHFTSTSLGVFALTEQGKLLRLTDARCRTVLRGLPTDIVTGWDGGHDELWLLRGNEALVLEDVEGMKAHTLQHSFSAIYQCGTNLYALSGENLVKPEASAESAALTHWVSREYNYPTRSRVEIETPLYGENLSAEVLVERVAPDTPAMLSAIPEHSHRVFPMERVLVRGTLCDPLRIPLYALAHVASPDEREARLRLRITCAH